MKPTKQQFCIADIRDLFGRLSHAWGRNQGGRCPIRTGYPFFILAALVFLASGLLVGCGGSSYSAPPTPPPPPTLPSAGSLSSSCTAAATIGAYNCQIAVASGKAPFTWTANTLPRGLMLTVSADTTTATISGTVQGQQAITTTSAFTALVATASAATTTVSVTLTVTDSASRSASLTFSITLTISPLGITTTSPLPGATLGSAYTTMVTAAGGLTPYTWTVATGSNLPAGLTLTSGSPSATISGTPTATGTFTFTLNVADSETPTPMTASATFTLTVSTSSTLNCPAIVNLTLCGTYGVGIRGFVGTTGPASMGASFVADSTGHVVSGVEFLNSVSGVQANVTITGGSYVMDTSGDGRGVLILIDANAVTRTFRFVLESTTNVGVAAIEEFDPSGTLAAGILVGPGTPPFAPIPANTILAVQLEGYNGAGQRAGMLGEFQVGSSGCNAGSGSFNSVAGEPVITNTAGTVNTTLTATGSCTALDTNTGIGTAQITISGGAPFTNTTLNFVYGAAEIGTQVLGATFLETDAIAPNQPILNGIAQPVTNAGGFASCAAPGACIFAGVGTTNGTIATTAHAVALLVRGVATPINSTSGTIAGVLDENFGGTITSGPWPYNAYTIDANSVGTITGTGSPTIHFAGDGRFMDESVSVIMGDTNAQNTTTIESPGAPYIIGESIGTSGVGATPLVPHVVGVVTPTGTTTTGTLPGTVDVSTSAGSVAGALGNGSYTIDSTTGRGTGTANANLAGVPSSVPIVIYCNRHRRFSVLDVQSSDPVLLGARLQ